MTVFIIRETDILTDNFGPLYELLADGEVVYSGDIEAVDLQVRRLFREGDTVIEEYVKNIFPRRED